MNFRGILDSREIVIVSQCDHREGGRELLKVLKAELDSELRKIKLWKLSDDFREDARFHAGAIDVLERMIALPSEAKKMIEEVES